MCMWTTKPYQKFIDQAPHGWEFQMYDYGGDYPPQELGEEKTLVKKIYFGHEGAFVQAYTHYFWSGRDYTLKLVVQLFYPYTEKIWSGKTITSLCADDTATITLAEKCIRKDYRRACACARKVRNEDIWEVAKTFESLKKFYPY